MSQSRSRFCFALTLFVTLSLLVPGFARAQQQTSTPAAKKSPQRSYDRLFLSFIEDATVVDRQWWEAQLEYSSGDVEDVSLVRGVVAFQPWNDVEIGGRMGFGSTDNKLNGPDGRGATDMDIWGKYYLGKPEEGKVDLAVGVVATVPTGDNTSGLGYDAFAAGFFGSLRWRISKMFTLSGNAGFQINEDGETLGGPTLDGLTAERFGVGVIVALSKRLNLVGEWAYIGERFEGTGVDSRLAASVNWRVGKNGVLRGSLVGGTSGGAPNIQTLAAFAWQFP
jgi:hypothetical protein